MSDTYAKGQLLKFEEIRKQLGLEDNEAKAAFGVSLSKSDTAPIAPANQQASGFLDNLIIDQSVPVYVSSVDGVLLHVNDKYLELASAMGDVSLSPGPLMIMNKMPSPTIMPVIQDVMASNTTVKSAENLVIKGKKYIFEGRHMPVRNARGDIIAVAGTYEDVTTITKAIEEAKQTQARFQDFARASSDWLWELDENLKVKSLSDRFTAVVGQPAMMFIGSKLDQFGRFETNLEGSNDGHRSLARRKSFRDQLFVIKDHTGREQVFHLSGVPVFNRHSGEFIGYRGVGHDVSVRYQQAEKAMDSNLKLQETMASMTRKNIELDIARSEAQQALKTKNEFLASMTHELKTPLNAIIGFAELFSSQKFGKLDDDYLNYAKDIQNSGKHLLELITDILDVTLMESNSLNLQPTAVSVRTLIHKSSNFLGIQASDKSIQLVSSDVDDDLYIKADEKRVMQILINLLSNAVKFTPEDGKVGLDVTGIGQDEISISVWDTGIGIAAENQELIFDKFYQVVDDVYARQQSGTGLGLHISRKLAEAMDGALTVTSELGKGARFTLTLPLTDDDGDQIDFI